LRSFLRSRDVGTLASDHPVTETCESRKAARRCLNENAATVGFIGNPHREAETRQRIKRTAHGWLAETESFRKSTHRVRSGFKRNAKEDCSLTDIKIRAVRPHRFRQYIFKQGKR
jgi:hypothetical protein